MERDKRAIESKLSRLVAACVLVPLARNEDRELSDVVDDSQGFVFSLHLAMMTQPPISTVESAFQTILGS